MTKKAPDAGQGSGEILDDAVREILLLGITAHIREGQNGDRGLVGQRRAMWRSCG